MYLFILKSCKAVTLILNFELLNKYAKLPRNIVILLNYNRYYFVCILRARNKIYIHIKPVIEMLNRIKKLKFI